MVIFPRRPNWATPLATGLDLRSLAARLRQNGTPSCRAREQGRCEGREHCPDCQWSEGPSLGG